MNILVTGARGFVGKNLIENLKIIRDGKDQTRSITIEKIFEYDLDTDPLLLDCFCASCDFVFNLVGVHRPQNQSEFMKGNYGFALKLLDTLKKNSNKCPVMYSSSIQATLIGRYEQSEYGKSKLAGEELFFQYSKETGATAFIYRFPNLFGKWSKPNYNSVVATFCNNIANDLPILMNDPSTELELLYIDDLVSALINALEKKVYKCNYIGLIPIPAKDGDYCYIPGTYKVTLGQIANLLESFNKQFLDVIIPEIPNGSFAKKLYSTYMSYLPKEKVSARLTMNIDTSGSFTEILKAQAFGQLSVKIIKPGIAEKQHWHNSKCEKYFVVSGHGLIQEKMIGSDELLEFEVSGNKIDSVHILPGYLHNIINLSASKKLIVLVWANEQFDLNKPETL